MLTSNTQTAYSAPYSLRVKDAEEHFGFKEQTLYQWISNGRLQRGKHYLKVGGRIVIGKACGFPAPDLRATWQITIKIYKKPIAT